MKYSLLLRLQFCKIFTWPLVYLILFYYMRFVYGERMGWNPYQIWDLENISRLNRQLWFVHISSGAQIWASAHLTSRGSASLCALLWQCVQQEGGSVSKSFSTQCDGLRWNPCTVAWICNYSVPWWDGRMEGILTSFQPTILAYTPQKRDPSQARLKASTGTWSHPLRYTCKSWHEGTYMQAHV